MTLCVTIKRSLLIAQLIFGVVRRWILNLSNFFMCYFMAGRVKKFYIPINLLYLKSVDDGRWHISQVIFTNTREHPKKIHHLQVLWTEAGWSSGDTLEYFPHNDARCQFWNNLIVFTTLSFIINFYISINFITPNSGGFSPRLSLLRHIF